MEHAAQEPTRAIDTDEAGRYRPVPTIGGAHRNMSENLRAVRAVLHVETGPGPVKFRGDVLAQLIPNACGALRREGTELER